MATRAYAVIKIQTEKEPTFNLWHDDYIVNNLDIELDESGGGLITIERSWVEELAKQFEDDRKKMSPIDERHYEVIINQLLKEIKVEDESKSYLCY